MLPVTEKAPATLEEVMLMQSASNQLFNAIRAIPEKDLLRWWSDTTDPKKAAILLSLLGVRNVMR